MFFIFKFWNKTLHDLIEGWNKEINIYNFAQHWVNKMSLFFCICIAIMLWSSNYFNLKFNTSSFHVEVFWKTHYMTKVHLGWLDKIVLSIIFEFSIIFSNIAWFSIVLVVKSWNLINHYDFNLSHIFTILNTVFFRL